MAKKFSDIQAADALRKQGGIISSAAKLLGVHRNTLATRINGNDELKTILNDARETTIDLAETMLLNKIKKGNLGAIIFTLKTIGRSRGYIERSEHQISGPDGDAIPHEMRQAAIENADSLQLLQESLEKSLANQEESSDSPE